MRGKGIHIEGKLGYRPEIVKLWTETPSLTMAEVRNKTGAPKATVIKVRRDLVAAGVLKGGGARWP